MEHKGTVDVIVVGCGPVGAFSALLLRSLGLRCLVFEKEMNVCDYPRAVALDGDAARLMGLVSPDLLRWLQQHLLPCSIDIRNGSPCRALPLARDLLHLQLTHFFTADAGSATILGPVPAETDAASGCPRVSFFHQPTLESKLRALFDSSHAGPSLADTSLGNGADEPAIGEIAAACLSRAPCARLILGAEVRDVHVGDDGAVSLSVELLARPSTRTALSCRFSPLRARRLSCLRVFRAGSCWLLMVRQAASASSSMPPTLAQLPPPSGSSSTPLQRHPTLRPRCSSAGQTSTSAAAATPCLCTRARPAPRLITGGSFFCRATVGRRHLPRCCARSVCPLRSYGSSAR